ncbi:hypothetical protein CCM_08268 [Cordyceps militaris CM01]|uniref:MEI5 protein n=1 Tax=Cordyceps militaris (strain CM01) TaxID=983644 RepID=G3JT78_CORMM|nr:uncharacterized protein CCM_08268 [Cordyceps militaris CM01]EGX88225.1 hypothetical protein CCM_08268 [Cordyceps militaris CM01]
MQGDLIANHGSYGQDWAATAVPKYKKGSTPRPLLARKCFTKRITHFAVAMAAPNAKHHTKEENGATADNANGSTSDFAARLSLSESFQRVLQIDIENRKLRERNEKLEATNDTNWATIANKRDAWAAEKGKLERALQHMREEMKILREVKAKASDQAEQIKAHEKRILSQCEAIKKRDEDMAHQLTLYQNAKEELAAEKTSALALSDSLLTAEKDLARSKEELEVANDELNDLADFAARLQPMNQGKEQIQEALANTFNQFLQFFVSEMSFDGKPGAYPTAATEEPSIPLPESNTPASKQMRIVAALIVSGKAMVKHIFRHALVSDDLDRVLNQLAVTDPDHESYVREVLLKLHQMHPDEQKAAQMAKVDRAVKDIADQLGPMVPRPTEFGSRLKPCCEMAAKAWDLTLGMENKVDAHFRFQMPAFWCPVPLEEITDQSPADPASDSNAQADAPQQPLPPGEAGPSVSIDEVLKMVWPVVIAHLPDADEPAESEMLSCGYVLARAQCRAAKDDVTREQSTYKKTRLESRRQSEKKRRSSVAPSPARAAVVTSAA